MNTGPARRSRSLAGPRQRHCPSHASRKRHYRSTNAMTIIAAGSYQSHIKYADSHRSRPDKNMHRAGVAQHRPSSPSTSPGHLALPAHPPPVLCHCVAPLLPTIFSGATARQRATNEPTTDRVVSASTSNLSMRETERALRAPSGI